MKISTLFLSAVTIFICSCSKKNVTYYTKGNSLIIESFGHLESIDFDHYEIETEGPDTLCFLVKKDAVTSVTTIGKEGIKELIHPTLQKVQYFSGKNYFFMYAADSSRFEMIYAPNGYRYSGQNLWVDAENFVHYDTGINAKVFKTKIQ